MEGQILEVMSGKQFWTLREIYDDLIILRDEMKLPKIHRGRLRTALKQMSKRSFQLSWNKHHYSLRKTEPISWRMSWEEFDETLVKF